ncbi:hypothetical protein AB1Y20_014686 [Prymnesium parvum]|uniref:VWFA domain-containing protein n=1 Tax=Prymnesium parvum TaxID=97485 RepID=A0AB34IE15_PRYPA|mmetsp:Transcript_12428/g.30966  ORF Transcript_12428/g.30966 Transcript_12428/m.30966 type:complete len:626 (+) Transcript_12428:5374-7251(+)
MTVMCELHSLGHRDWLRPMSALAVGRAKMGWPERVQHLLSVARPVTEAELRTIDATSSTWADKLDAVMKENKLLCLFSSRAAQQMSKLVTTKSVRELTLMLSSLFPRTSKAVKCLSTSVSKAVHASDATVDWPDQATAFLEAVAGNMGRHGLTSTLTGVPPATQQIGDGPLRYTATSSHASVLRVLLHIFKDRPPESCEILWCDERTTSRSLLSFLQCARHHPGHRFVLLQVDALPPALQHILLRVFLDSRNSSISPRAGHNLHCIETGACMLQSATWVALWDADEVCDGVDLKSGLSKWVFHEDDCIREVTCFHGPPGSGKTHQLRKELSELDGAVTKCALSITEAFSLKYAATKLQAAAMEAGDGEIAISVQIQLGKFKASELDAWTRLMSLINKFFFKLLVLRSIEADTVFNVPPSSKLKVFVEIPDRCGHLQRSDTHELSHIDWMADELPVVHSICKFTNAAVFPFDISRSAAHVSAYLKAYEDGSIDQLYNTGSRDVVFVLDNSASMSGGQLDTCKRCMRQDIFDAGNVLQSTDNVALVVFDDRVNLDLPLAPWEASRSSLRQQLDEVQYSTKPDNGDKEMAKRLQREGAKFGCVRYFRNSGRAASTIVLRAHPTAHPRS